MHCKLNIAGFTSYKLENWDLIFNTIKLINNFTLVNFRFCTKWWIYWFYNDVYSFLTTLSIDQHGFFPGRSTVTSHVVFLSYLHAVFELDNQVNMMYTDFSKAFDSIDHNALLYILYRLDVGELLLSWFSF